MGKMLMIVGGLIFGYGAYIQFNPPPKETPEQKAAKEKIEADKREAAQKAADEKAAADLKAAEEARLKKIGDDNEALGLNRDGSAKVQ